MRRASFYLSTLLALGSCAIAGAQNKASESPKKLPDGVYAVLRDGPEETDVLPLRDGEVLAVNRHRYLKADAKEPPRYLVVRSAPDVDLALAGEPKTIKEGEEIVGLLLKLQPKGAMALERLTTDNLGKSITIVIGGEVVTMHKIRAVIKGGDVQITSCAPGAANYLLEQLQARQKNK
jgi:hypothetical protein